MYILRCSIPMMCLLWHIVCCVLSVVDHAVWVRNLSEDALSKAVSAAHLAFCIVGLVAFAVGGAPLFIFAYKYGLSKSQRSTQCLCGLAIVFITWFLPMLVIELVITKSLAGERSPLDGLVFALAIISSAIGGCIVWFGYMRLTSYYIHRFRGLKRQINQHDSMTPCPMQLVRAGSRENQPNRI